MDSQALQHESGDGQLQQADATGRRGFWRTFAALLFGALVGAVAIFPYALALSPPLPPEAPPLPVLIALGVAETLVLSAIAIGVGLRLGPPLGLGAPLLRDWLLGVPDAPRRFAALLVPSLAAGIAVGVVLLALDPLVFGSSVLPTLQEGMHQRPAPWQGLLASLYGGIVEEILLRLGIMTFLVWILAKVTGSRPPGAAIMWAAAVLAALLFGLGHLPATAQLMPLTPVVVGRALLLNGIAGVTFGWLYWRRDLLAAMVAHWATDIVLHVAAPLVTL